MLDQDSRRVYWLLKMVARGEAEQWDYNGGVWWVKLPHGWQQFTPSELDDLLYRRARA